MLNYLHTDLVSATYRIKEVSHPLGDDEGKHYRDAERDVSGTLDDDHSQT